MATEFTEKMHGIGETTKSMLQKHFERGIPLSDMKNFRKENIERFAICLELIKLVEQDPTFDDRAWLRHVKHRSFSQVHRDLQMLEIVQEYMFPQRKARARYIVEKTAERCIKRSEAQGDVKNALAAARLIADVNRLGEPDLEQDEVRNTFILPTVLAPIHEIDSNRTEYSDKMKLSLLKKYHATEDQLAQLVREKVKEKVMSFTEAEDATVMSHDIEES